jgi:hypothetical protein
MEPLDWLLNLHLPQLEFPQKHTTSHLLISPWSGTNFLQAPPSVRNCFMICSHFLGIPKASLVNIISELSYHNP